MITLLGQGLSLAAVLACAVGAPIGFIAGVKRSQRGLNWTRWITLAYAACMVLATLVMEYALITHDYSVRYVALVGSNATPLHITIVSLWSALDGSILFWGMVLGLYVAGVAFFQRKGHEDYLAYTLGTLLSVGLFFSLLIAGPGDPFQAMPPPIPTDGPGPNALLQNHALMIIHPPMLYLGYVGMSVPFAMAVAALLRGQLGPTWLRPMRNWLLIPTGFLTVGIMLGGWWSYEVLGWGGYWAWDPVENASFLPWLTAIAAVHSAVVQQRRGTLKAWTVILVLMTFVLTILGTFLTRSGVVNSVHAFTEGTIGPLFLGFLALCLVASVVLLAMRVDLLVPEPGKEGLLTREAGFLVNNLLFVTLMFTVLVGTLFPIFAEAVRGVKVSVGEPYFNRMAVPVSFGLLMLLGIGPALPWGRGGTGVLRRALLWPLPAAAVGLLVAGLLGGTNPNILLTGALAGYALWVNLDQGLKPARQRVKKGDSLPRAFGVSLIRAPRRIGAYVVHFGFIVTFVAIAISSSYQTEAEATLSAGGKLEVGGYQLTFEEARGEQQPHRVAQIAKVRIARGDQEVGFLEPALNHYPTMMEPIGTPAVKTYLTHDLYLTLMNVDAAGETVGLRAIVTPAVLWVWLGVLMMAAGTLVCLVPPVAARSVKLAQQAEAA